MNTPSIDCPPAPLDLDRVISEFGSQPPVVIESEAEVLCLTDEMRLRTWARRNHVPADERDSTWHSVVLDEMARRDAELD